MFKQGTKNKPSLCINIKGVEIKVVCKIFAHSLIVGICEQKNIKARTLKTYSIYSHYYRTPVGPQD